MDERKGNSRRSERNLREMWRCVWRRFETPDMSQQEIADEVGLSRPKVSRLLNQARQVGMLRERVEVNPPRLPSLEVRLKESFGLYDAVVVPRIDADEESTKMSVGIAAARYFEERVKDGSKITLAAGTTLAQMVEALTPRKFNELRLYPLWVIDKPVVSEEFSPNSIVMNMRSKYGGNVRAFNFQVSLIKEDLNEQKRREILKKEGINGFFKEAKEADIFLIGIGNFSYPGSGIEDYVYGRDVKIEDLKGKAVGEISCQPFDSTHVLTEEEAPFLKRMIYTSLGHLRKKSREPGKHVIAMASGRSKTDAVRASLFPDILCYDVLITDEELAERILSAAF